MSSFREVRLAVRSPHGLLNLIGPTRVGRFQAAGDALAEGLSGRTVWNVSLDESTTGVGELVRSLLGYIEGFGITSRWLVVEHDPVLRQLARWIREGLQGFDDGQTPLGADEHADFEAALAAGTDELAGRVQPGDLVLLHDPGPAALAPAALARGATVVWRCHAGSAAPNEWAERSWAFLQPYVQDVHAVVLSRRGFLPSWVASDRLAVIAPSIDPLAPKNRPLELSMVHDVLTWAGLLAGDIPVAPRCVRSDGTEAPMRDRARLTAQNGPPPDSVPLVVQITRWDRLKDMPGVLAGFAHHVTDPDAHLLLAGPDPSTVAADHDANIVFQQCARAWAALSEPRRDRVHLATLPADPDDSATIVNALQRHAAVVTQKAIAGDQSAAVAEAMFKARPIVASGVGGIRDQIHDHHNGLLIDEPADLAGFGAAVTQLLTDPKLADQLRYNAYQDAIDHALPDHHLLHWAALVSTLLDP